MSKFDFGDYKAAWKSISGKKWERPLPMEDGSFRLFHDRVDTEEVEYNDYNSDGKVLNDKGEPIPGHLDNILGGWTEPFGKRKPIMESVTEVVEDVPEEKRDADYSEAFIAATKPIELNADRFKSASHRRFDEILHSTIDSIRSLSELKGGEYAGDLDRLANFRRNGAALDVPMEVVWAVFANKHHDAIMQYIKDLNNDTTRPRSEPISGRAIDLIVYLVLFLLMEDERNNG